MIRDKIINSRLTKQILNLLMFQGAEQVTHFCRLLHEKMPDSSALSGGMGAPGSDVIHQPKPLSESQRIRKVIVELIETERQYVKVSG